jgi:thiol-disulfide isomerase/thioredoxin
VRKILTVLTLGALCALAAPAFSDDPKAPAAADGPKAAESDWIADFDKAVAAAKAAKKDMLVDFTGSDWCGWCIKLDNEVFSQADFAPAKEKFVLVKLDYPNGAEAKAKVPNPARNDEIRDKYGIQGYPSILIITADGDVLARTGYRPGGPKPYVEFLATAHKNGREALDGAVKLEAEYAAATDAAAKTGLVEKAIGLLEKLGESGGPTEKLAKIARNGTTIDPENKSGLKLRTIKALMAADAASDEDRSAAKALDPKNESGLLERVLMSELQVVMQSGQGLQEFVDAAKALAASGNLKDPEIYVAVLANAVGMSKQMLGDEETAKAIGKVLREKGPKDNPRLTNFLNQILGPEEKPAEKPADAPAPKPAETK